eukprot:6211744-Pleurochrysis_carterae.AAC.6
MRPSCGRLSVYSCTRIALPGDSRSGQTDAQRQEPQIGRRAHAQRNVAFGERNAEKDERHCVSAWEQATDNKR